ncbi:MalY/PatB family protein [Enterococcus nangangensis]
MTSFDEVVNRYGTYSTQWDYIEDRFGAKNLLPFAISDMDFPIPEGTQQVLAQAATKGLFGYTRWNHPAYKESITRWFATNFETSVESEWVVYSPSVIYSLSLMLQLLSEPGDGIVTLGPCYDAFFALVKNNHRNLQTVGLKQDEAGVFNVDFAELASFLRLGTTKIFLLCNPHNPTGRAFTVTELQKMIALCNEYDVAIIADEIHMDIRRAGIQHQPLIKFLKEISVPCGVFSSASKTFNLPGVGGSYGLIPDESLREKFLNCLKGRDGLSSIPYPALLSLMDCYQKQQEWRDALNLYLDQNFLYVKEALTPYPQVRFTIPEATYLAWLDVRQVPATAEQLQNALKKAGVAITPGETYGPLGKDYLRLNVGAPRSKVIAGIKGLQQALNEF